MDAPLKRSMAKSSSTMNLRIDFTLLFETALLQNPYENDTFYPQFITIRRFHEKYATLK